MFSATDFPTNDVVGQEAIQYVIDNVYMFQERYDVVMGYIWLNKTSLLHEDESLYCDIHTALCEYFHEDKDTYFADELFTYVDEIFG